MAHVKTDRPPAGLDACIKECLACYQECARTEAHCLEKGGEHAAPEHIALLRDCGEVCLLSADLMLRGSRRHGTACGVCAEFCRACAESCERMAGSDARMKACAQACRRCAESCEKMARA